MNERAGQHLDLVDGFRGMLAFWVFAGHMAIATHSYMILFAEPGSAVDLFMFVSGLLMAWHWMEREAFFTRLRDQSVDFYIRRFFRIAPIYFPLLIVAWILHPDPVNLTWQNLLLHATFLFGLFPHYLNNNLLPDWSISLEMQFYMLFPLIMLALRYAGPVICVFVGIQSMQIMHGLFGLYTKVGEFGTFGQPSLIFFKLHIFVAGMLLAKLLVSQREGEKDRATSLFFYALLIAYSFLFSPSAVARWALFLVVVLIAGAPYAGGVVKVFSCRFARFMGDVSYSVYLVHLLVISTVVPYLLDHVLTGKSPRLHFVLCMLLLGPLIYAISYLLHRTVELRGIELGKVLARRWRKRQAEALVAS